MGKAAIYARVSTQEQADKKLSIPTQIADCEKYSEQQGDTVVKRYEDQQSGQDIHSDREQFEQMLKDAKSGLFDKIVVWRPDRLFRGLTPAAKLARILDETGIEIAGVTQPVDRAMIGLWSWVSEMELRTMTERFRAGKRANAREHDKWPGGSIRYGYNYVSKGSDSHTGKLEINEPEAKVILNLFQKIANDWTITRWVRYANAEGIPTKNKSKGWTIQYTSLVLRSLEYIGQGGYDKASSRDAVPLEHPVIVPKKLFNKVQAKLSHNRGRGKGASKNTYSLQHLGRCGVCGARLGCVTHKKGYRYIYCMEQKTYPHISNCFEPKSRNLTQVEDIIWDEVEDVLRSYKDKTTDFLFDQFENSQADREKQIAKAKEEISRCNLEKQRILTSFRKGWATETDIELQIKAVNSDQSHRQQELSSLEALADNSDLMWDGFFKQLDSLEKYKLFGFDFTTTPEQKKELLNLLLEEFILNKDGTIELRFKLPLNEEQVAEKICTLSMGVNTCIDRITLPYFPVVFRLPLKQVA